MIDGLHIEPRPPAKGKVVTTKRHCKTASESRDAEALDDPEKKTLFYDEAQITGLEYTYPLKLIVPDHASSSSCKWVYPVTFGGGLVEGDHITLHSDIGNGTSLLITTQSSTKVFHCLENKTTQQHFTSTVGENAFLAILPDPIVCFKDAIYSQSLDIQLTPSSNLVLVDWFTAGRIARGELWQFKSYESKLKIHIADKTVFRDAVNLCKTNTLSVSSAMRHYEVIGTIIIIGKSLKAHISSLLETLGQPKAYGSNYSQEEFISISPLKYKIQNEDISGCYLKLSSPNMTRAFEMADQVLHPLYEILGGSPYDGKY